MDVESADGEMGLDGIWSFRGSLTRMLERLTHEPSDLELHSASSRHLHALEGLRVLCNTWCSFLDFEDSEVPELEPVASSKFIDHLIKKRLDRSLDIGTSLLCRIRDPVDEIFFGCGRHAGPFAIVMRHAALRRRAGNSLRIRKGPHMRDAPTSSLLCDQFRAGCLHRVS